MRVLFLTKYTAGGPSSRYRVLQFLPFLEARGIHASVHALHDDHYLALRYAGRNPSPFYLVHRAAARAATLLDAPRHDLVFIQKELFPHVLDLPEWWLARTGTRYVVDLDDAIHLAYAGARGWRSALREKTARVIARASLVLAGNRYLEAYARRFNPRVLLFPTVVDTDRFAPRTRDEELHEAIVGWIGTPETVKYLDAIMPALDAVAQQAPVSLLVVGARAPGSRVMTVQEQPWSEAEEADDLRRMDIGIMPLADDEWSKGKCSLKLLQYMSTGVASVTSPRGSAPEFVRDGENAFFAASSREWCERIRELAGSRERRAGMGQRARADVVEHYSLRVWGPRFADAIEWAAGDAPREKMTWEAPR